MREFKSLTVKLLTIYLTLVAVSAFLMFSILEVRVFLADRDKLLNDLRSVLTIQSSPIEAALWEVSAEEVQKIVNDISALAQVESVLVRAPDGQLVASAGIEDAQPAKPEYQATRQLVFVSESFEEPVGTLRITVHDRGIYGALIQRLVVDGAVLVFMIIVLGVGTIATTNRLIGRPLSRMLRSIDKFKRENVREQVEWQSADELGRVVDAYNEMQTKQAETEAELIEHQSHLEELVASRTEELVAKETQFRLALDNMQGGMRLIDNDRNYIFFNKQYLDLYDYPEGLLKVGDSTRVENFYSAQRGDFGPGDPDALADHSLDQLSEQDEATSWERTVTGSKTLRVLVAPTPEGGLVSIVTDITKLKEVEEELRVARDMAEAATKAKATFLATMSHEIRTPMGGVIGMVDLLQQSALTDDQRQMIDTVRDSAHSLLTIINDILDFSKIEAGKLDLEAIPISVRDIVEGAGEALAVDARTKGIGLSVYVDPDIPDAVVGDQVRLRQILFNFGSNAIKFTEQGKVLIRADKVPSRGKKKATVQFQVIDQGIGIPKEAQEKLFQVFSQVEASTTRRFGGTGLGLSICQRLTEMMNGEIGVESVPGEGSTFSATITFPVAKQHDIKSDGHDLDGLNVLFALGDDDMRELLPRYLEHWGATVTAIAETGEVKSLALKAAGTGSPFNVIVLGTAWPLAERIELAESLVAEASLSSARYVIACRDRAKGERKDIDQTVYMDTDPLRRGSLIKSVAVAAGRASPEVEYDDSEITLDAGKAPTVAEAEAMGQLILLAEDNVTNQDVIRRQLTMLGYALEIANDGKEALELLETRSFAILLTDCHMPNVDGFELTETIRKSDKGTDGHFPIIAITASVMKEEIDHCFASGMNDYLPKPLEMTKLKEMLRKWMPAPTGGPVPEDEAAEDGTTAAPAAANQGSGGGAAPGGPIDVSALTYIFGDDQETIHEVLADFVDPAWQTVAEIEAAFEQREAKDIGALGHKLKSSSRAVGANALSDLCQALEAAGKNDDWGIIEDTVPRLREQMQAVADCITAQP